MFIYMRVYEFLIIVMNLFQTDTNKSMDLRLQLFFLYLHIYLYVCEF